MKIYLFLTEGFEEIEAVSVIDILRRAGLHVTTVSITKKLEVCGSHNIKVSGDCLFEECDFSDGDMIIIPGGPGAGSFSKHDDFLTLIKKYNDEGKWIAAICAAPTIPGKIGLLKDKKAVCYPGMEKDLLGARLDPSLRVALDGKYITSKGPGCSFEFALKIVECLIGIESVKKLKESMLII